MIRAGVRIRYICVVVMGEQGEARYREGSGYRTFNGNLIA